MEKTKRFHESAGISRRDALKGLGGVLASSVVPPAIATAEAKPQPRKADDRRPNILWITGEGVPVSALSCYGSQLISTPHIDRIANEGVRFENGFTTNALCAPSRATLLTGTYTHMNGMVGNPDLPVLPGDPVPHFDPSQITFAKILKQHGYQTGTVGKWHLPVNPADVGFDYFVYKNGAGGPYYQSTGYLGNPRIGSHEVQPQVHEGYETDVMTDLAIKGMQQFTQPFLMMLQYFNAHRPFDPPHKYEHLYDGKLIPEPGTFWDDYEHRASPARDARLRIADMPDFNPPSDLTPRERQQWNYHQFMAHFLGTLRSQDDNIGRIFDYLESSGLIHNTIIVYTSDHGFFLGDHGWFDKRFMYEQALRVPWMIRLPDQQAKSGVRSQFTMNIDNAPTVLDLVGLPVPGEMQGRSLVPLIKSDTLPGEPEEVYYHYYEFGPPHWVAPHYGIRTDRYKLIYYYKRNEWELFDLQKDPDEMDNLVIENGLRVAAGYESVIKDLASRLQALRSKYKDSTGAPVKLWLEGD
ncbi:MAG TPA: sulfatase [Acidobacteriaceae bacterium]|nr:sulfatase [Acidobacteriaceae bacterium]